MSESVQTPSLRFIQLKSVMVATSRQIDGLLSAFDDIGERKLELDDRLVKHREQVPLGVESELEVALLESIYSELFRKYKDLLAKGAALGEELGTPGHYTMP
jgi:hypothetical protein